MIIERIHIFNVRNISEIDIRLGNHLNIFHGENGSGKTSILEAIYMLSSGKSFRSRKIRKIIKEHEDKLTIFAQFDEVTMGLERSYSSRKMQVNGESVSKVSTLAKHFPVLIITQDSHRLFDSGPLNRRQFLDWGLFHVEHDFLSVWSNYRKLLKNRNVALSNNASESEIIAWDQGLVLYGSKYTDFRKSYLAKLLPHFIRYARLLFGNYSFDLEYKQGWSEDKSFGECLAEQYPKDRFARRTVYGPHRSDLIVKINNRDAKDHVSRGQQKMLVYALYFSQVTLLKEIHNKETLILLDDLGAELDVQHAQKLLSLVSELFSQACITTANIDSLPLAKFESVKMFHVEHGSVCS